MDYSKFVTAIHNNDRNELNKLSDIIKRVLMKFLRVRLNASQEDAEDCIQNTMLSVITKIKEDKLNNPDTIIYYLFTTAKNDYLKLIAKRREITVDELPDTHSEDPKQLLNLLDKERQRILKLCISKLNANQSNYINYWFNNPDDDTGTVARHFNISVNNAWTKKHRILQQLKSCVGKYLNL